MGTVISMEFLLLGTRRSLFIEEISVFGRWTVPERRCDICSGFLINGPVSFIGAPSIPASGRFCIAPPPISPDNVSSSLVMML